MTTPVTTCSSFLSCFLPCWCAPVPDQNDKDERVSADWCNVKVERKKGRGRMLIGFCKETSTGDLYWKESRENLAVKSFNIIIGTPFYTLFMIVANALRIAVDIGRLFWNAIFQLVKSVKDKSIIARLFNAILKIVWEIPVAILHDIWRIVRSPIFGLGIILSAAYGVFSPFEGRKWISKVESAWHEGAPYTVDMRYGKSKKGLEDVPCIWNDIKEGKIIFLAYCMQKRGNIEDKIAGIAKYKFVT